MAYRVRAATPGDADDLGTIQVRAWRATRQAVVPDQWLGAESEADRARRWRQRLDRAPSPRVAVAEDGTVVGFIAVGTAEDGGDG